MEELEYRLLTWPGQAENDFAARLGSMKQQVGQPGGELTPPPKYPTLTLTLLLSCSTRYI